MSCIDGIYFDSLTMLEKEDDDILFTLTNKFNVEINYPYSPPNISMFSNKILKAIEQVEKKVLKIEKKPVDFVKNISDWKLQINEIIQKEQIILFVGETRYF
jgi:hypothetical protein